MTARVRVIDHGIVLQDFSNLADPEAAVQAVDEARRFMARRPADKSTRLVTDVSGSTFNPKVVDTIRKLAEHHRPYVAASAIIGVTPLMRVVWRMIVAVTKRDIRIFETLPEAVAWLSQVSVPASAAGASPQKP